MREQKFFVYLSRICAGIGVLLLPWSPSRFGGVFLLILAFCCTAQAFLLRKNTRWAKAAAMLGRILFGLFVVSFLLVQGMIYQGMRADPEGQSANVVLVLGARVYPDGAPSATLAQRLLTAKDFLDTHPQAIAILCGGQGGNEPCPEAEAMQAYLLQKGVDADRLLLEDQSNNTIQNIANAKALLEQREEPYTTVVISSDFHLARARRLMQHAGLPTYAIPAHTPYFIQRAALHMREYCSIMGLILTNRW